MPRVTLGPSSRNVPARRCRFSLRRCSRTESWRPSCARTAGAIRPCRRVGRRSLRSRTESSIASGLKIWWVRSRDLARADHGPPAGRGLHTLQEDETHRALAEARRAYLRCPAAPCQLHRSEEHTSELQSPTNLVCRLLLEKK